MDVGESGLVPDVAPKKQMSLLLKIVLCFLVVVIIGLVIAIMMLFLKHEQPAKKCAYENVADVDAAILDTFKLSEGEELDALEDLVKECKGSEYEIDFRIARALEFNRFDYYELAYNELQLVDEGKVNLRQKHNLHTAYAIVYEALGNEEKAIEYRNSAMEIYREISGEGGTNNED